MSHGIPQHIILNAPAHDFSPKEQFSRVCGACAQSDGSHYYACPVATEARRQERILALRYEYATFDPSRMK